MDLSHIGATILSGLAGQLPGDFLVFLLGVLSSRIHGLHRRRQERRNGNLRAAALAPDNTEPAPADQTAGQSDRS